MSVLCPHCRAPNQSAAQICRSCGALLLPFKSAPSTRHPCGPCPRVAFLLNTQQAVAGPLQDELTRGLSSRIG